MVTQITHPSEPDYPHFLPEISDAFQRIVDTYLDEYNEHKAFCYLVAELFETTNEEKFEFTDGAKDGGIDFLISDSPAHIIAQCKCPELSGLMSDQAVRKFDNSPLEELQAAIAMLLDPSGDYDVKVDIKRLRGDFQRDLTIDPEATSLSAILAVMGKLTGPARQAFDAAQQQYAKQGVDLKLVEWEDIYQTIHALKSPADIDFEIQLGFDDEDDLLAHSNYCYVLANAFDFYTAFREQEWNLFEWNVRYQLHRSPINRRIVSTLKRQRGRRFFHHYNNGLLITCRGYSKDITRKRLTLSGPQIVNGCQTVRAICEAYDHLTPSEQEQFRNETKVQVKVLQTTDPDLIAELVVSTNDQNPMKPRNLKSNSSEQRELQQSFRNLRDKWFYQRKDGEFQSLLSTSARVRWFRKSDYSVSRRRFRQIDNQDMAKAWYAFTGHSHRALRGGVDYFSDEPEGVYRRVFLSTPGAGFWSAFAEPTFHPDDDLFEPVIPTAHQYLLALGIAKYIDSNRISYRINRQEAINRGIQSGALRGDVEAGIIRSTNREVDEYLLGDIDYNISIIINNMREIMIELYSYVLTKKHLSCDATTSQALIYGDHQDKEYFKNGFANPSTVSISQDGSNYLGPVYGFLIDCVKQYYYEYESEIKSAPRLKSYLAQRSTINRMRDSIVRRNQSILEYDVVWKLSGATFLDSLPGL